MFRQQNIAILKESFIRVNQWIKVEFKWLYTPLICKKKKIHFYLSFKFVILSLFFFWRGHFEQTMKKQQGVKLMLSVHGGAFSL